MRHPLILLLPVALIAVASCQSPEPTASAARPSAGSDAGAAGQNPLGNNAGCCVCHIPFAKEPLSKTHLKRDITCAKCHGPSIGHANDEKIGATKPDVVIKHEDVPKFCRTCHKVADNHPEKKVLGAVLRKAPEPGQVCTDCHGKHRIKQQAQGSS
ncbi:MAG: cytochrome c3 family protein [Phycisphaerae bacterium]|nr:cytochrome c3 family protein [Phycisphaerae bacterium]